MRAATLTRRTVAATVATAFVLALALSAFDAQYGVPPTAATCLSACEDPTAPVPAAARLVAEQEALGRACRDSLAAASVAVLQAHDGAAWVGSVAEARAAAGSSRVEVLAYCG